MGKLILGAKSAVKAEKVDNGNVSKILAKVTQLKDKKSTYLTKRILVKAAKSAGDRGAKQAMENLGYVIIAKDGMLVRLNKDGSEVEIRKLVSHRTRQEEA